MNGLGGSIGIFTSNHHILIQSCIFNGSIATNNGGAIHVATNQSYIAIQSNTFVYCSTNVVSGYGGSIFVSHYNYKMTLNSNVFQNSQSYAG